MPNSLFRILGLLLVPCLAVGSSCPLAAGERIRGTQAELFTQQALQDRALSALQNLLKPDRTSPTFWKLAIEASQEPDLRQEIAQRYRLRFDDPEHPFADGEKVSDGRRLFRVVKSVKRQWAGRTERGYQLKNPSQLDPILIYEPIGERIVGFPPGVSDEEAMRQAREYYYSKKIRSPIILKTPKVKNEDPPLETAPPEPFEVVMKAIPRLRANDPTVRLTAAKRMSERLPEIIENHAKVHQLIDDAKTVRDNILKGANLSAGSPDIDSVFRAIDETSGRILSNARLFIEQWDIVIKKVMPALESALEDPDPAVAASVLEALQLLRRETGTTASFLSYAIKQFSLYETLTPTDLFQISDLSDLVHAGASFSIEEKVEHFLKWHDDPERNRLWVFRDEAKIIQGYILAKLSRDFRTAEIKEAAVAFSWQNKGLETQLIEAAMHFLTRQKAAVTLSAAVQRMKEAA